MAEEDQQAILEDLFRSMRDWTREKMRDWIDEIMGEDENMKPVIDQLYEREDITNDELIGFFRGMLMGGDEAQQEEQPEAGTSKQKKSEPLASKKQTKKPPPSSSSSSSSSSASEKKHSRKRNKRKLLLSDSSSSSGVASDATVDLSSLKKKHKTDKQKQPPVKIKKDKLDSTAGASKSKIRKLDSDDDDFDHAKKNKHVHSEKVKLNPDKGSSGRERDKGDKYYKEEQDKYKLDKKRVNDETSREKTAKSKYEKEKLPLKDKTDKTADKGDKRRDKVDVVDSVKIKTEKDDKMKEKQFKDSFDRREKADNHDHVTKSDSKLDRDKTDKAYRDKNDKPLSEKVKSDTEHRVKDRTDKELSARDKSAKELNDRERTDKDLKERHKTDKHLDDNVKDKHKTANEETDKPQDKDRSHLPSHLRDKPEKDIQNIDKADKPPKVDKADKPPNVDKADKPPKVDKADKPQKVDIVHMSENLQKPKKHIDLSHDHFDPKEYKPTKPNRPRPEKIDADKQLNVADNRQDKVKRIVVEEEIEIIDEVRPSEDRNAIIVPSEDIADAANQLETKTDQAHSPHEALIKSDLPDITPVETDHDVAKADKLSVLQTQFPRQKDGATVKPKEVSHSGPIVRPKNAPVYLDPEFTRYRKKFQLRAVTVQLYDIRKQSLHWRSGDKVYRHQLAEERRRRKEQKKLEEKKEKFSERGTRILPFEKRPENAELYRKKGEITREKPKIQTQTEKERLLMELHRKDRDREKEKKIKTINSEFKIPKKGEKPKKRHHGILQEQIVSSFTPLKPAANLSMSFDKKRLVVQQKANDSWQVTPEEERAMLGIKPKPAAKVPSLKKERVVDLTGDNENDLFADHGFQDDYYHENEPEAVEPDEDGSQFFANSAPPPIKECDINEISRGVVSLLNEEPTILPPTETASHGDIIIRKVAKWFRNTETEPYFQTCPSIPEQSEENYYTLMMSMGTDDDEISFVGNVSNPDGEDYDLQDSEITSTARDPDVIDEYCGARLLHSKIRVKPGDGASAKLEDDCFQNIFAVRRGCNYDKHNFQANCNLCGDLIVDKRHLGAHIRSTSHRANMATTSLKLIGLESKLASSDKRPDSPADTVTSKSSDKIKSSKTKDKESNGDRVKDKSDDRSKDDKSRNRKEKDEKKTKTDTTKLNPTNSGSSHTTLPPALKKSEDTSRTRRKSRTRSRSPHRRRRSRSRSRSRGRRSRSRSRNRHHRRSRSRSPRRHHHRRSRSRTRSPNRRRTSRDKIDEFLAKNDRSIRRASPPRESLSGIMESSKKETGDIFREKLILQGTGKWTPQLEARWKLWEDEEAQLKKVFAQKRKMLEEKPEDHPRYAVEWPKFWEKRYQELTEMGKDAETYDYAPEWKVYWGKLSQSFLDREMAEQMQEIRIKYGMDLETLKVLNAAEAPAPPTVPNVHPPPSAMISPVAFNIPPPSPFPSGQSLPPGTSLPFSYPPPVTLAVPPPAMGHVPVATNTYPGQVLPAYGVPPPVVATNLSVMPMVAAVTAPVPVVPQSHALVAATGEDYNPKPMSISSGSNISPYSDRVANLVPASPKVTIDDIKSTWENLTGQKIQQAVVEKAKSVASNCSNKSKDYDFDGLDVVEVLRLMTGLEDELSFLAISVLDYYKLAEKMEAEKLRKSFELLRNIEFVTLLHQCRDKFFAILRANVSPSDVMKKLNVTVFAMNALIDSPMCQKIRPSVPSSATPSTDPLPKIAPGQQLKTETTFRKIPAPSSLILDGAGAAPPSIAATAIKAYDNPIEAALVNVPMHRKIQMSSIIAESLIAQGKDSLTKTELMSTLMQIMSPIISDGRDSKRLSPAPNSSRPGSLGERPVPIPGPPSGFGSDAGIASNFDRRFKDDYTRTRIASSSRSHVSDLSDTQPQLFPEIRARAVSPPREKAPEEVKRQNFGLSSFLPNPYRGNGGGGGGGRRDYMGNPIPEDQGDFHYEAANVVDLQFDCPISRRRNIGVPKRSQKTPDIDDLYELQYSGTSRSSRREDSAEIRRIDGTDQSRRNARTDYIEERERQFHGSTERIACQDPEVINLGEECKSPGTTNRLPPGILELIKREKKQNTGDGKVQGKIAPIQGSGRLKRGVVSGGSELSLVSGISSSTNRSGGGRKRRRRKEGDRKESDKRDKHRKRRGKDDSRPKSVSAKKDEQCGSKNRHKKKKKRHHSSSIESPGQDYSERQYLRRHSGGARSKERHLRRSSLPECDRYAPPRSCVSSTSAIHRVAPNFSSSESLSATGSQVGESRSKRHHRSNKKSDKRKSKEGMNEEPSVSGVSRRFWDPPASIVSSEENFIEENTENISQGEVSKGKACSIAQRRESGKSDKSTKSYRKNRANVVNESRGDTEEGEIVSSSESFDEYY